MQGKVHWFTIQDLKVMIINIFPNFPSWPTSKNKQAEYVALFPNVMLGIHKDHYYASLNHGWNQLIIKKLLNTLK